MLAADYPSPSIDAPTTFGYDQAIAAASDTGNNFFASSRMAEGEEGTAISSTCDNMEVILALLEDDRDTLLGNMPSGPPETVERYEQQLAGIDAAIAAAQADIGSCDSGDGSGGSGGGSGSTDGSSSGSSGGGTNSSSGSGGDTAGSGGTSGSDASGTSGSNGTDSSNTGGTDTSNTGGTDETGSSSGIYEIVDLWTDGYTVSEDGPGTTPTPVHEGGYLNIAGKLQISGVQSGGGNESAPVLTLHLDRNYDGDFDDPEDEHISVPYSYSGPLARFEQSVLIWDDGLSPGDGSPINNLKVKATLGNSSKVATAEILNVAPALTTGVTLEIETVENVDRTATISSPIFFDPGAFDAHTLTVTWGDGVSTPGTDGSPTTRIYPMSPGSPDPVIYPVTLEIVDDDTGKGRFRMEKMTVDRNVDDDDSNNAPDRDEATATSAEDDLVELDLAGIIANRPETDGTIFLKYNYAVDNQPDDGYPTIRLWADSAKATLAGNWDPCTGWKLSDGVTTVWIEGTQFGSDTIRVEWEPKEASNGERPSAYQGIQVALGSVLVEVPGEVSVRSIVFDDLGILPDPSALTGITLSEAIAMNRYGKSFHWLDNNLDGNIEPQDEDLKLPVAYVRNTTPTITATFAFPDTNHVPPSDIEIRGTGTGGMSFPAKSVTLHGDGSYHYQGKAATSFLDTVKHYDDYVIEWQTRVAGGNWISAGKTKNDLYLTLGTPTGPLYHTTVHNGTHYGDGATTSDEVIVAVWNYFKDLNIKKQDETTYIGSRQILDADSPLKYWSDYVKSENWTDTQSLLQNMNGSCGGFADLFVLSMLNQGIDQGSEFIQIDTPLFVKAWHPNGPQIDGFDILVFAPYDDSEDADSIRDAIYSTDRDKYLLNTDTQLSRTPGVVRSQNNQNPKADFGNPGHTFVRYVIGNVTRWFDTSYGIEYTGVNDSERLSDFENTSVYGLVQDINYTDLEIHMNRDLDGNGIITNSSGQILDLKHEVVKRQDPETLEVQYQFRDEK